MRIEKSRANDRLTPQRRRLPKPDRRRVLELLAASPHGCTEAIMLAHGITIAQGSSSAVAAAGKGKGRQRCGNDEAGHVASACVTPVIAAS
jgi:hypothetical protein